MNDSIPVFTSNQHKAIIADIELMQYAPTINKFAIKWCTKLSEVKPLFSYSLFVYCIKMIVTQMETTCWWLIKLATIECLSEAEGTDNDDDLLVTEIIHAL